MAEEEEKPKSKKRVGGYDDEAALREEQTGLIRQFAESSENELPDDLKDLTGLGRGQKADEIIQKRLEAKTRRIER